ncbi:hypothetical protein [Sphingobacterium bovistauri]|uniref:Fasciclin domain-containing protein n=1 Tax=Sphingobacterium bovistauri TaxID=2781959 RepID=A0ABS7Z6U7_9SPHI|nr:hypothetical protein [Sphingobacterium bovistauri]MCA5005916.1 hypothetical protein [Sphingobacterium bovistauri]
MKALRYIYIVFISIFIITSCEKGNDYYVDFTKSNITFDGTIYDYFSTKPGEYDSLILLLEILPEVKTKLSKPDASLSYFAVNNRSFSLAIENLNNARKKIGLGPLYLEDLDKLILDQLANKYLFDQMISINDLKDQWDGVVYKSSKYNYDMHWEYRVLTASGLVDYGNQQIVFSDVNNSIYRRYWQNSNTKSVDLNATNGYIHTLTSQHEFAFGKLTDYFTKTKK